MAFERTKKNIRQQHLNPTRIIALAFAVIILSGTLLLMLPISSANGQFTNPVDALFTATSATCVTGLVVFDTGAYWSWFGKFVILGLIEVGGLGFMSAASLVVFLLRRKVGLRERMIMAQSLSLDDMQGVVRLQRWVLIASLSIQALGALILFLRFLPSQDWLTALTWGIFHSVSAFCNAGFDIIGANNSMINFYSDPIVLITLMLLIVVGGLGFFVWEEVSRVRNFRKLSVYSKLVLLTTAGLILSGAFIIALLEWNNSATLGAMSFPDKILNSFFQSVTLRTAGFATFDQGALTDGSKLVSIVYMLIGGSSGSTAGGVKTVTFVVLLLFLFSRMRGRSTVTVFKRSILPGKLLDAMTIVVAVVALNVLGTIVICATSPVSMVDALFESASALGTVGLTAGATVKLHLVAKLVIILFMYFGRVGVLTLSLGFLMGDRVEERFRYAHTNLLIG